MKDSHLQTIDGVTRDFTTFNGAKDLTAATEYSKCVLGAQRSKLHLNPSVVLLRIFTTV